MTKPTPAMLLYRDILRTIEPATDHQVSAVIRRAKGLTDTDAGQWGISTINGRRNDWFDLEADCIEAVDRVRVGRVTRTRWRIKPGSRADKAAS